MNWIKTNLVAIVSFLLIAATAVQGMHDFGLVNDLQLAAMLLGTFVVIFVPLLKVAWAGILKTTLDLVSALIVILIPFVGMWVLGMPVTRESIMVIVIAFIKVFATEIGVQIRTDWGTATPKAIAAGS